MKLFLYSLLLIMIACSLQPASNYDVYIDKQFTTKQQEDIAQSLHNWEAATHYNVIFNINIGFSENKHSINIIYSNLIKTEFVGCGKLKGYTLGGCTDRIDSSDRANIYLPMDSKLTINEFQLIVMHESGHALGLGHLEPGHIMSPTDDTATPYITCADVYEYYKLRNITELCY